MKLPREFIRLPLQFDAQRLADEVAALPDKAWQAHPTQYKGNAAVPLISVNGEANDFFAGPMGETEWLKQSPYLRQVLASFQVVLGRSRLMGLKGGSQVPRHSDTNYHWFQRVRIHVPIITFPEVMFHCHDQAIHMGRGEAWIFDNWKAHHVINPTAELRVHLVADTLGSASFWGLVDQALKGAGQTPLNLEFDASRLAELQLEKFNTPDVMHPAEVELLSEDLIADLLASGERNPLEPVEQFVQAVRAFCQDWKSLWALHGDTEPAWSLYQQKRDELMQQLLAIRRPLVISSNDRIAQKVMLARVLVACVHKPMTGFNELQYAS
ncbi:MAG TPA: aspartyl/asparaginyl beta-hydroxylase domain-containing protein [Xanthomonadales bacterium]|nr:aspartyl/asparaginyl beta-hydroxylase domain-containing protein [Xanthomonadales bacterium]